MRFFMFILPFAIGFVVGLVAMYVVQGMRDAEREYRLEDIHKAFIRTFNGSGERWFSGYVDDGTVCDVEDGGPVKADESHPDGGTEYAWLEFFAHLDSGK